MMSGVILGELRTVGNAFLCGAVITIVYDILRIFRRAVPHGNFWIGVEDFFFWIWTAFWIFSVLYRENDGSLRSYTLLAMAFGMLLYHLTISDALVKLFGWLLKRGVRLIGYPLKSVKKFFDFIRKKLKKIITSIIIKLIHSR